MRVSPFNLARLFLLLILPSSLHGQSKSNKEDDYRLVVSVNLVGVLVTVTTAEGALVSGLKAEDFQVYEDGQLEEIVFFAKEAEQPLRLSLLFDSSASIATELKTQQDSAIEFLQSIFRPGIDRVSIFQFSEVVEQLQKFATRLESLNQAIRSVKPGGGTSLYDAVYLAAKTLSRQPGRRVIVVVSDGEDTTSQVSLDECLRTAQNSEAVLYALVVQPIKGEVGRNLAGEHTMIFLANRTGGRFFKVASAESLRSSYLSISDELRTQYYLGYYPKPKTTNQGFHKIEVRVSDLTRTVRAREGYYSGK